MNEIIFNDTAFEFFNYRYASDIQQNITSETGFQILYIKQGTAKFVSKKNNITANKGDLFYIPTGEPGVLTFTGDKPIRILKYGFRYFPTNNNLNYPAQIIKMDEQLTNLMNEIPFEPTISSITVWKFYEFLDELQKRFKTITHKHLMKIEKALEYMNTHDVYDVPTLAKICNMSESGFYSTFKAILGATPIEEKHKRQAQKADILLRSTNLSIDEIASKVGFQSTQHFRKIFKNTFGVTPNQARKNYLI